MPQGPPNWRPRRPQSAQLTRNPRWQQLRESVTGGVLSGLPSVITVGVNSISETTANIIGSINPNGTIAQGWFSYGTSLPLPSGTTTPSVSFSASTNSTTFTFGLTGLTTGTTYYVAAVAQNTGGTVYGQTVSFTAQVPSVVVGHPIVPFGQPSVTIPHFDVPFKIVASLANRSVLVGAQVVEQDTLEEVVANVRTIVLCPVGACQQLPTFGRADLLFAQEPLATNELVGAIQQWEPRASESVVSELKSDGTTWKVTLDTSTTGAQNL